MATDPDRQSDGLPARRRRQALSELPGGLHAAFQVAWALAMTLPGVAKVTELVARPTPARAVAIIEVTGEWALVAALAWAIRVAVLTTHGRWGARIRQRMRDSGRRRRTT